MSRRRMLVLAAVPATLVMLAWLAISSGLAKHVFYSVLAYLKQAEVMDTQVLRLPPDGSPYEHWLERARSRWPMFEGMVIDDVNTMALAPWPEMGEGVRGMYLRFADYQTTDGRILEIPAAGSSFEDRHLYEKSVYVLSGAGHALFTPAGEQAVRLDWAEGDLFAVPLNIPHRFFNTSKGAARLLLVTSFPLMLNALQDEAFLQESDYFFRERFTGQAGFPDARQRSQSRFLQTGHVTDIRSTPLRPMDARGAGSRQQGWRMAGNSMLSMHVSEIPARRYKKAHRHSSDAFILLLSGHGFSMTWPGGFFDRHSRIDWRPGTLFVPPTYWYHQHLNTGDEPARYLAINPPQLIRNLGLAFRDQLDLDQPEVRQAWREALEAVDHAH